jgi:hypothetical protein
LTETGESLTSLMLPLSKDFGNAELWRCAWGALKGDNVPQLRRPSTRSTMSASRRLRPLKCSRRTPASGGHRPDTGPAQGLVPRRNLPVADCGHLTVRDKAECRLNGHIVSLGPAAGSAAPNARAIRKSRLLTDRFECTSHLPADPRVSIVQSLDKRWHCINGRRTDCPEGFGRTRAYKLAPIV